MKPAVHAFLTFGVLTLFVTPALAGTGNVRLKSTSIGVGFGLSWGSGTLEYDGVEVPFTTRGYKIADVGVMQIRPSGTVSNLEDIEDMDGQFSAADGALTVGAGGAVLTMKNENDVVMTLSGLSYGLGMTLAAEGMYVTLGEIPEPPPVAAPPPPEPVEVAMVEPEPEPDPCEEEVVVPGVAFEFDSDHLSDEGIAALAPIADFLLMCPDQKIKIEGYTDSVGAAGYNVRLSQHRADSVKYYLESRGVEPARLSTIGYGAEYPVASNDTSEGRAQNRRAEIQPIELE